MFGIPLLAWADLGISDIHSEDKDLENMASCSKWQDKKRVNSKLLKMAVDKKRVNSKFLKMVVDKMRERNSKLLM